MADKCPNINHPDYKLMVRLWGKPYALYLYNKLGERIPSQSEIADIYYYDTGEALSKYNNPNSWDIENDEGLIERWITENGKKKKKLKKFKPLDANKKVAALRTKYPLAKFETRKVESPNTYNTRIYVSTPFDVGRAAFEGIGTYEQRLGVNYTLSVIKALDSIRDVRRTVRLPNKEKPYIEKNLRKLLGSKGVSNQQIDMLFDYMRDKDVNETPVEDLIISMEADLAYAVEIETSLKEDVGAFTINPQIGFQYNGNFYIRRSTDNIPRKNENPINNTEFNQIMTLAEKENAKGTLPTQYYSNLTVEGGTNYTEQEIRTPQITPSIKGHAQFATDNGIGWFRSDEQSNIDSEYHDSKVDQWWDHYSEEYDNIAEDHLPEDITRLDYIESRVEQALKEDDEIKIVGSKTRRILEIQSDLFQKGRNIEDLVNKVPVPKNEIVVNGKRYFEVKNEFVDLWEDEDGKQVQDTDKLIKEWQKEQMSILNPSENQFLQLLNQKNNWVKFFIQSIIQDSAKRGYESVLFPTGETAAKVEGHETIADEIDNINNQIEQQQFDIDKFKEERFRKPDSQGNYWGYKNGEGRAFKTLKEAGDYTKEHLSALEEQKQQLKSQGVEKLKPVENFYENTVKNNLKKLGYETTRITDEYGNEWYKYNIKAKDLTSSVDLMRTGMGVESIVRGDVAYRQEFEKYRDIMLKTFPEVKEVIEDVTIPQLGLLEAGGSIIRVNPNLMTRDTIGHEFGHLLIDLIGGLDNPIVKSALKQLEGSDLEKRVKERYSDLVGEDEVRLKKEILAQAIGEETTKIFNENEVSDKAPKWERTLMRLFKRIKQLLKIEKSDVRRLANMVVGTEAVERISKPKDIAYEKRGKSKKKAVQENDTEEAKEDETDEVQAKVPQYLNQIKEVLTKETKLRNKAIDILLNKIKIYTNRGDKARVQKFKDRVEELESNKSPLLALLDFASLGKNNINGIYKRFLDAKRKYEEGDKDALNVKELVQWAEYVGGFDILEEIRKEVKDQLRKKDLTTYNRIIEDINETILKKNEIKLFVKEAGEDLLTDKFGPTVTRVKAEYRLIYEREWRNMSNEEKSKISMDEYINNKVATLSDILEQKTIDAFRNELDKGEFDISYLARYLDTVLNSDDIVVATMVKNYALELDAARREGLEFRDKLIPILRKLEDMLESGITTSPEKFYDFMLEKDEDGNYTQHIVSRLYSDFRSSYDNLKTEVNDREDLDRTTKARILRAYREMNIKFDYSGFNDAKYDYIKSLVEEGALTQSDLDAVIDNDNRPPTEREENLNKLLQDKDAAGDIIAWISEHIWDYRTPQENGRRIKEIKKGGTIVWGDSYTDWSNPQYDVLEKIRKEGFRNGKQTDPRILFYDLIVDNNTKADKWLPYQYRLGTKLPSVAKDFVERLKSNQPFRQAISKSVGDTFVQRAYDTEKGQMQNSEVLELTDENANPKMFLPVFYSNVIDVGDQSFDLASIYYNRYKMATEYNHKNRILPDLELTKFLLEQRPITRLDSKANPIKNANEELHNRELTKRGINSRVVEQFNDFMEAVVYGKGANDEGTFTLFNVEIDKAKAADALNRYTALNMLSLNFVQGTANVALGETMQIAEAFAGEFYTMKNYRKASKEYNMNFFGIIRDIGSRKPKNKVNLILERFDALHDYNQEVKFRKATKFRNLMMSNTLFFTSHMGEHLMQSRSVMAMLDFVKAKDKDGKVILNDKGKELSLLDAFTVTENGELKLDKRVELTDREIDILGHRMKRLLSRMHGEYSSLGKIALQRMALGRMVYMFRKFVVPGWKRRWEVSKRKNEDGSRAFKYNELGEFFTEGSYITTGRFLGKMFKELVQLKFSAASTYAKGITSVERANLRRTLTEAIALISAFVLGNIFLSLRGEADDEAEEAFLSHMAYQALRLRSELFFFSNPVEAMRILKSPMASMSLIENTIRAFELVFNPLDDDRPWARFETGPWKDRLKIHKYAVNALPIARQIPKIINIDSQMRWFKN